MAVVSVGRTQYMCVVDGKHIPVGSIRSVWNSYTYLSLFIYVTPIMRSDGGRHTVRSNFRTVYRGGKDGPSALLLCLMTAAMFPLKNHSKIEPDTLKNGNFTLMGSYCNLCWTKNTHAHIELNSSSIVTLATIKCVRCHHQNINGDDGGVWYSCLLVFQKLRVDWEATLS